MNFGAKYMTLLIDCIQNDKYGKGMKYASFRKNRRTTWYAFFKKYEKNGETFYLVRYIANNHSIAHYL